MHQEYYSDFYNVKKREIAVSDDGIFSITVNATIDSNEKRVIFRPKNGMTFYDLIEYINKEIQYHYGMEPLTENEKDTIKSKCMNSR